MFKYYIKVLIAVVIFTNINVCAKEETKKYPPYPEVWGRDLTDHPLMKEGYSFPIPYVSPNKEVLFILRKEELAETSDPFPKAHYAAIKFFEGTFEYIEDIVLYEQQNKLTDLTGHRKQIILSDATHIESYHINTPAICQDNDLLEYFFIKGKPKDKQEKLSPYGSHDKHYRHSIIGAMPYIARYFDTEDGYCDRGGPGGGELIYQQLYNFKSLIKLEDDTFLVYNDHLMIRFDKDFNTKFKPQHDIKLASGKIIKGNFFSLPYSIIEELDLKVQKNHEHATQGLHDQLLLYLYKRQEDQKATNQK